MIFVCWNQFVGQLTLRFQLIFDRLEETELNDPQELIDNNDDKKLWKGRLTRVMEDFGVKS